MAVIRFNFLSKYLGYQTNVTICLPRPHEEDGADFYRPGMKFQTLTLLHGYSGDSTDYADFTGIVRYADDARIAVAAFDTTLTYAKLVRFCDVLRAGAVFYATHPDLNCPVDGGMIPDLGAFLALIEASTGRRPEIVGKPFRPTVAAISRRTGVAPAEMAFVGDRLYTDMAVARNNGAHAVLLMSGETDDAMLAASSIQPDAVFADAAALLEAIRGERP